MNKGKELIFLLKDVILEAVHESPFKAGSNDQRTLMKLQKVLVSAANQAGATGRELTELSTALNFNSVASPHASKRGFAGLKTGEVDTKNFEQFTARVRKSLTQKSENKNVQKESKEGLPSKEEMITLIKEKDEKYKAGRKSLKTIQSDYDKLYKE